MFDTRKLSGQMWDFGCWRNERLIAFLQTVECMVVVIYCGVSQRRQRHLTGLHLFECLIFLSLFLPFHFSASPPLVSLSLLSSSLSSVPTFQGLQEEILSKLADVLEEVSCKTTHFPFPLFGCWHPCCLSLTCFRACRTSMNTRVIWRVPLASFHWLNIEGKSPLHSATSTATTHCDRLWLYSHPWAKTSVLMTLEYSPRGNFLFFQGNSISDNMSIEAHGGPVPSRHSKVARGNVSFQSIRDWLWAIEPISRPSAAMSHFISLAWRSIKAREATGDVPHRVF